MPTTNVEGIDGGTIIEFELALNEDFRLIEKAIVGEPINVSNESGADWIDVTRDLCVVPTLNVIPDALTAETSGSATTLLTPIAY